MNTIESERHMIIRKVKDKLININEVREFINN